MSTANNVVDLNTAATPISRQIAIAGERTTAIPAMSQTLTTTQSATSTGDNGPETQTQNSADHRSKNHRRQESMYTMTGLYSESNAAINSSDEEDDDVDAQTNRQRHRGRSNHRNDDDESDDDEHYAETTELTGSTQQTDAAKMAHLKMPPGVQTASDAASSSGPAQQHTTSGESDTAIGCHSRQPSGGPVGHGRDKAVSRAKLPPTTVATCIVDASYEPLSSQDCGLLSCRPAAMQKFARIKIFVLLLSMLVTLQQALSSGYINSVITTIEKRFDIPSSYSGLIASSYEIGNVITVIFVSYLGSRRHIPVWIGIGAVIMGIGSLIFMVPHFTGDDNPGISLANKSSDNICRGVSLREPDMDLGRLSSGLANPPLAPHNNLREDNCIQGRSSTRGPVLMFVLAQLLLGCGGSPLFTLGTTYVDDHVRTESASMYIGCMYSMAAFGPVVGFLLGAYLLSFHMDSFAQNFVSIDPGDRRWVGMWWGGFLVCGILLILVAIPFFSFPKVLTYERKKLRKLEMMNTTASAAALSAKSSSLQRNQPASVQAMSTSSSQLTSNAPEKSEKPPPTPPTPPEEDSGYGQDIKDIPRSMWRLVSNPVYITTCLGACMELMIVSGFIVFLPKYLETQFSLGKSQASVFTGSIAIPGACIGIFMGGCFLKRFQLTPRGAVQFVLVSNLICLSCYTLLFFLGCENLKMAGTTIPYYNSSTHMSQTPREPFQVNLTAACNFGCECRMTDVEPVCGNNGLTYFSPCHAGCTAFSSTANYTNCACVHANVTNFYAGVGGSQAQASVASADFAEVTMVPVATAGPCTRPCRTIYPFLILLFFMTFIVASTQMPLLMIVLRSVSEEERSFALGMQFVIFRLFGYIPAPILFGNLIDSTCLLWKSTCGEKGGRCLIYNIEAFRYKYVGLCAVIKIVALVIFGIDWWLVTKKKCIDDDVPMAKEDMSGSMLSLNNASIHRAQTGANGDAEDFHPIIATPATGSAIQLTYENSKRILVASRHLRNESKTIQLEMRYDDSGSGSDRPQPPLPPVAPLRSRNTHYRSSSCDVKMMRDEDTSKFKRPPPASGHSRNNSRDLAPNSEFRAKLTHSRNNSSDRHNANIKYILNYLNTSKLLVPAANLGCPSGGVSRKQHTRNHSYDQIYMPQNIRIDQEFQRRFNKNVSRKNSVVAAKVDPPVATAAAPSMVVAPSGGGTAASKDLHLMNIMLTEDSAGNSVLRHRRTSSKDLGRLMTGNTGTDQLPEAGAGTSSIPGGPLSPKHVRQNSQHRIQIEDGTIDEADTDAV